MQIIAAECHAKAGAIRQIDETILRSRGRVRMRVWVWVRMRVRVRVRMTVRVGGCEGEVR